MFGSPQQYSNSDTDLEISGAGSEEDISDYNTVNSRIRYTLSQEESRVLSDLGNDWELAARWFIRDQTNSSSEPFDELGNHAEWLILESTEGLTSHGGTGDEQNSNESTRDLSSGAPNRASESQKRGREPEKPGGVSKDEKLFRKRKRDSSESSNGEDERFDSHLERGSRAFACHFHKYDPGKYGPWAGKKFKQCLGLTAEKEFRHIKYVPENHSDFTLGADRYQKSYHLDKHRLCDICCPSEGLDNQAESQKRPLGPCSQVPNCAREGIDRRQWKDIEAVLKVERAKKGKQKRPSLMEDVRKWFEIWKILFPGVDKPLSPCK